MCAVYAVLVLPSPRDTCKASARRPPNCALLDWCGRARGASVVLCRNVISIFVHVHDWPMGAGRAVPRLATPYVSHATKHQASNQHLAVTYFVLLLF